MGTHANLGQTPFKDIRQAQNLPEMPLEVCISFSTQVRLRLCISALLSAPVSLPFLPPAILPFAALAMEHLPNRVGLEPLTDVRGSVDSVGYRTVTVRERLCYSEAWFAAEFPSACGIVK